MKSSAWFPLARITTLVWIRRCALLFVKGDNEVIRTMKFYDKLIRWCSSLMVLQSEQTVLHRVTFDISRIACSVLSPCGDLADTANCANCIQPTFDLRACAARTSPMVNHCRINLFFEAQIHQLNVGFKIPQHNLFQ
jgi:hypothetical protein